MNEIYILQYIFTTFTHLGMKRHLEKLRAARNAKFARHDYDDTVGSSSRSTSTGSVATGMVGFWGGAPAPFCYVARAVRLKITIRDRTSPPQKGQQSSHRGGSPLVVLNPILQHIIIIIIIILTGALAMWIHRVSS